MDLVAGVRKEGSRGGRGEFKWEDVKDNQHRENYLGHSLMAPVGRWQKNKDLSWYAKGDDSQAAQEAAKARSEEIKRIKEAEQDALSAALGFPVEPKMRDTGLTGANAIEQGPRETGDSMPGPPKGSSAKGSVGLTGEERGMNDRILKKEKKVRRHNSRSRERETRHRQHDADHHKSHRRHRSRSRSRDVPKRRRSRSRSYERRPVFEDSRGGDRSRRVRSRSLSYERRRESYKSRSRSRSRDRKQARSSGYEKVRAEEHRYDDRRRSRSPGGKRRRSYRDERYRD